MKKVINVFGDVILMIAFIIGMVSILIKYFNYSKFNLLSKLKMIDFQQIFGGFVLSFFLYLITQIFSVVFHDIIKKYFPTYEEKSYMFFHKICLLSVPLFFTIWMILSLKETQFNIITNLLASTVLFSDIKIGKNFLGKFEIFTTLVDHRNDKE